MTTEISLRWRKATNVNREHALFELVDGSSQILDIGFTDEGVLEVAINPSTSGIVVTWDQLHALLEEGKALAERDQ